MNGEESVADIFRNPHLGMFVEIAMIVAVAVLLITSAQRAIGWLSQRLHGQRRLRLLVLVPALRLVIISAAFVLLVPVIVKPSLQNMVALLGTVALALGFALKDFASSLIAGVVAVGEMPYRNGDWIEIGGVYGEVRHVGMRTVRLVTPDDSMVSIPHAKLWTESIANANDGSPRLQCVAEFFLHPQHDAGVMRQLLADVALTSAYLHFDEPIAVVVQDKAWGTHYRLKAYPLDARQQFRFVSDLTVRGKAALLAAGACFATAPTTAVG